jgi:hypothetical protein
LLLQLSASCVSSKNLIAVQVHGVLISFAAIALLGTMPALKAPRIFRPFHKRQIIHGVYEFAVCISEKINLAFLALRKDPCQGENGNDATCMATMPIEMKTMIPGAEPELPC